MRNLPLLLCLLLTFLSVNAQQECWILFKYKGANNTHLADSSDLPVNDFFIQQIEQQHVKVLNKSRWLNAIYVSGNKTDIKKIQSLSFVQKIVYPSAIQIKTCDLPVKGSSVSEDEILRRQINMMQGEKYIKEGLTGKGIKIGVLDVGFAGYKKTKELQHLIKKGLIKDTRNFSTVSLELNLQRDHGTQVLSCLAGKTDSVNIGLATEAEYYLATYNKVPQLVEALEWFEEKGVQILNNSTKLDFGYYEKEDLNGESLLATKAISKAAKSGMLVFCAMGNEGDTYWRSLISPSDAKGIISVGSVSSETGLVSYFSSLGPSFDKRPKPELVAVGESVVANQYKVDKANGTSFATPLVSGFAACAWQLHPLLKKDELYEHLLKSGNMYPYFDYSHGYGLPQAAYFFRLKMHSDSARLPQTSIQSEKRNDTTFYFMKEGSVRTKSEGENESDKKDKSTALNPVIFRGNIICKEGKFNGQSEQSDLDNRNYCFYHIADEKGFLKKYAVLKLENENIFYITNQSVNAGYTIRIYCNGSFFEQKF